MGTRSRAGPGARPDDLDSERITLRENGFVALRSYAPIGDGRTITSVAQDDAIDGFPIPDLDSVPVFAAVVDSSNGGRLELVWNGAVRRNVLILKQLIFSPTGAIAAAATTSVPERLCGGKNWDYRYAWVRDTAYTLDVLRQLGIREETPAAISWLLRTVRRHGAGTGVFYRLDGSPIDPVVEREASGWRGIGPVVTGNRANSQ